MAFAENTEVPIERSRAEIERLLTRYGATRYASGWDDKGATIAFEAKGRRVRFVLTMPSSSDPQFTRNPRSEHKKRPPDEIRRAHDRECRRRWRALSLVIKAKLEAVETGITTFEDEFLAHIVAPDGRTVGEILAGELEQAYQTGRMPPLLLGNGPSTKNGAAGARGGVA